MSRFWRPPSYHYPSWESAGASGAQFQFRRDYSLFLGSGWPERFIDGYLNMAETEARSAWQTGHSRWQASQARPPAAPQARAQPASKPEDPRQAVAPARESQGAKQALAGRKRTNLTGSGTLLGGLNVRRATLLGG